MGSKRSSQSAAMMMQQHQQSAANFVRVAAKTAMPIVSSVPKCKSSKAFRPHPLDTVNGVYNGQQQQQQQQQPVVVGRSMRSSYNRTATATTNDDRIIQQQGDDDVVLIFNDDHLLGGNGAMPMIGRRLASKSARAMQQAQLASELSPHRQVMIDYSQPPTIQVPEQQQQFVMHQHQHQRASGSKTQVHSQQHQQQQQPVVGRRSHRIQQQQQLMSSSQSHLVATKSAHRLTANHKQLLDYELTDNNEYIHHSSRSGHLLTTAAPMTSHLRHHQQAKSLMPLGSGACSTSSTPSCHLTQQQLVNQQLPAEYSLPYMHQHEPLTGDYKLAKRKENRKSARNPNTQPLVAPYASCCSPIEPSSLQMQAPLPPNSCPDPRCCPPLPTVAPPSVIECSDPQCCPQFPSQEDLLMLQQQHQQLQRSQRSGRQAKRLPGQRYAQQDSQQLRDAYRRASSCSERRMSHHHSRGVVNALPVAAKPTLLLRSTGNEHLESPQLYHYPDSLVAPIGHTNYKSDHLMHQRRGKTHHRSTSSDRLNQVAGEDPAVAAVTQMYESLAAELKAKLGNTKTAPILLPPKDYDTLSRKQGKLTGIELRRSTNPQLVGPIVPDYSRQHQQQQQHQQSTITEGKETSSPRPLGSEMGVSARGSDTGSNSFCNRSQSNSSSGLGSIVCGTSASNSPESPTNSSIVSRQSSDANDQSSSSAKLLNHHHQKVNHINQQQQQQVVSSNNKQMDSPSSGDADSGHHNCGSSDTSRSSLSCDELGQMNSANRRSNRSSSDHQLAGAGAASSLSSSPSSVSSTPSASPLTSSMASAGDQMMHGNNRSSNNDNRGKGMQHHHPGKVSTGVLWNGRVEIPLKVNSEKNGNTYLATKQIIY